MTAITYRDAVTRGIAQEMRRDPSVVFLGEDVAAAGGVFKTTPGLLEQFGPERVRDTPISEQAILGAAIGAAMTGLRPIAEIMFSDFFAVCWDLIANEMAKIRYMSDGQLALPLVVRCANGAGLRFGAQHSQSVENWAMAVPGLKVVAPSNPRDVIGLFAAAVRDPDPVLFFEHKGLYPSKGEVPDGEITDELGRASVLRQGGDATILALAAMVPRALTAAGKLSAEDGIEATVIDVRSLVPLDTRTILAEVTKTGRLFTVEENPRLCGWGAEIVSIVAEEAFGALTGPAIRITTPHIPLPAADKLEDHVLPSVDRIVETVSKALLSPGTPPVTPVRGDPSPGPPLGGQGPRNSSGGHMAWQPSRTGWHRRTHPAADRRGVDRRARRRHAVGHRPGHRGRAGRGGRRDGGGRTQRGRSGRRCAARLGRDAAPATRGMPAPDLRADDRTCGVPGPADGR